MRRTILTGIRVNYFTVSRKVAIRGFGYRPIGTNDQVVKYGWTKLMGQHAILGEKLRLLIFMQARGTVPQPPPPPPR
jgi:hypothetical protein